MPPAVPIPLDSTPEALVVYQHRARVRRVAEVDPVILSGEPGAEVQVRVSLPLSFDRDSIQVEFNQPLAQRASLGGVTVEELENAEDAEDGASQKRREELEERVKKVKQQISWAEQDIREIDSNLKFVEEVVNGGLDPNNKVLLGSEAMWKPETWQSQLTALEEARREHGESHYKLQGQMRELKEELSALQRQLQSYRTGVRSQKIKREGVRVVLSVETEGPNTADPENPLKLYVSYMINEAFWEAAYEVHLNTRTNTIQTFYNASVTLHRGEDFSNVCLTLCSTAPRHLGKEPELTPWRCGLVAPPPAESTASTYSVAVPMMCAAAPMAFGAAATEEVASGVANFVIPNPVTIRSDGEARRFPLVHLTFAAEIEYVSVPALDPAVYTRVLSTNDSDFLLLPGRAALFLDGDFLCSSDLPRSAPGGKLSINFGVDRSIELKRVLLTELTAAQKNRLNSDKDKSIRTFVYRSTLHNRKSSETVTVTLKEKVPKSNDELLKVRLVEPEALPTDEAKYAYDSVGRVELKVTIPPNASREVLFGFLVEAPQGKHIYHLDDRH